MAEALSAPATEWQVVHTAAGTVTLVPMESLRARVAQLNAWATMSETTLPALRMQAADRLAACGAILVPRSSEWAVPPGLDSVIQRARAMVSHVMDDDRHVQELEARASSGGVFGRIGAWRESRAAKQVRTADSASLRATLIQIAEAAPETTIPEADAEKHAARDLEARADALDAQIKSAKADSDRLSHEVAGREAATQAMGFDSLYESASLQTRGPQPVQSPLVLKSGETAYLSVPASLARMATRTRYVGGSSGFSFPIGHTGIRYRVGSYSGRPVHQQSLAKLDSGTFVLTNVRVAFVGRAKSTSIALTKILHVEVYNDGISLFREGRENPDFYLLTNPKYATFLLNWFLGVQS